MFMLFVYLLGLISAMVTGSSVKVDNEIPWDALEQEVNKTTCGWKDSAFCARRTSSKNMTELPRCSCDEDCWKYGDCCFDAAKEAWLSGKKMDPRWKCQDLPVKGLKSKFSIYMISGCPENWTDYDVEQKCKKNRTLNNSSYIMDLPVVSFATNITYANVYCAICNEDTQLYKSQLEIICPKTKPNCGDLLPTATYLKDLLWSTSTKFNRILRDSNKIRALVTHNETFFLPSTNGRKCKKSPVDDCRFITSYLKYCSLFTYYVDQFKNPFCASCIGPGFKCGVIDTDSTQKPDISFSLLLDFNQMHGDHVGIKKKCPTGRVYDPIYERCVLFFCGKKFKKVGDSCEPIQNLEEILQLNMNSSDRVLNHTCRTRLVSDFVWLNESFLFENSTNTKYGTERIEIINSSTILICIDQDEDYISKFSIIQSHLSISINLISIICLMFNVLIYGYLPSLRNVHGLNLLSLSTMLLFGQLLLFAINTTANSCFCKGIAILMHFAFLSAFFWMNVISADICRTFRDSFSFPDHECKKKYRQYSIYAWCLPFLIVVFAVIVDNTNILPEFRPGYGDHLCWITRRRGLFVFFAIPLAILLLENVVFFFLAVRGIFKTKFSAKHMIKFQLTLQFILYLKLALIMGLTWVFGFVASVTESTILWYLFIIFNASQGLYIFVAFTLKADVIKLLKEKLPCSSFKNPKNQLVLKGTLKKQKSTSLTLVNTSVICDKEKSDV